MNKIEQNIIVIFMFTYIIYLVMFQFYIYSEFTGNASIIPENIIETLWLLVTPLGVVAGMLCLRDIYYRNIINKPLWALYIVFFFIIGLPHYFFKYARHPR